MRTIIALLALCFAAHATDIYVSPSGSGSSCTQASPCTLSQGFTNYPSGSGATIHFAAGTYATFTVSKSGASSGNRLILLCDKGQVSATAAINQCKVTGTGTGITVSGSYVTIQGLDVGNNANMGTGIFGLSGSSGSSLWIIGNYIHDLAQSASGPEGVGCPQSGAILTNNGSAHTDYRIIGNTIVRYGKYPFPSCFNSHGIYSAANSIIENNLIGVVPTSAIQVHSDACNVVIANNTLFSAQNGVLLDGVQGCANDGQTVGKNTIKNNLSLNISKWHFQDGIYSGGTAECTSGTPNLWANNITDDIVADFSANYHEFCGTFTPNPYLHGSATSLLVNFQTNGSGDYHLKSGSIAIDAGTNNCTSGVSNCTPTIDLDGNARPAGLFVDVGAYEFGGATVQRPNPPTGLTVTAVH